MFAGLTEEFVRGIFDVHIAPFIETRIVIGNESDELLKRSQGSLVVLKPVPWEPKYHSSECDEFRKEVVLFEHHFGGPAVQFELPFDVVARAKAYQSFVTGLPSSDLNTYPWMYQPSWTRWGGSAVHKPEGANVALIVAYSGGTAIQDFNIAQQVLNIIANECRVDFAIELTENPNLMWIGAQPPQPTRLLGGLTRANHD